MNFPKDFVWGAATASYQIEGGAKEGGRGESIWDRYSHEGKIYNGETGDIACDHFHKYAEDIKLLSELGFKAYRFSISWSRILPKGRGEINEEGVLFYERIIEELQRHNITPYVTIFHWDLPQVLEDEYGGWKSKETVFSFVEYVSVLSKRLMKKGVMHWITMNEFVCFTDFGYYESSDVKFAPGCHYSRKERNQIRHNALLAHGYAVIELRKVAKELGFQDCDLKIGVAENLKVATPIFEREDHIRAAKNATRDLNACFSTALLEGRYLESYILDEQNANASFDYSVHDLQIISSPLDFFAVNFYTSVVVKAKSSLNHNNNDNNNNSDDYIIVNHAPSHPHMHSTWLKLSPDGIYWATRWLKEIWNVKSVIISENGCSCDDQVNENGQIIDEDRIMYLQLQLRSAERAIKEGLPIHGYFVWSLLDNFEWLDGYSKRFGIVYVDFNDPNRKRTVKESALFLQYLIYHEGSACYL